MYSPASEDAVAHPRAAEELIRIIGIESCENGFLMFFFLKFAP